MLTGSSEELFNGGDRVPSASNKACRACLDAEAWCQSTAGDTKTKQGHRAEQQPSPWLLHK